MKRLCFGTLFKLIAMAKGSGIAEYTLCESMLSSAGASYEYAFSKEKASRLKSGVENVPDDTITSVRSTDISVIEKYFAENIIGYINGNKKKQLVLSLVQVIREDSVIDQDTLVGVTPGYEKRNIIKADRFTLASFLANLFVYTAKEVSNTDCRDAIREIGKDYLAQFDDKISTIDFDEHPVEASQQLTGTLLDKNFDVIFEEVASTTVSSFEHPSTAKIYQLQVQNEQFQVRGLKKFLNRNLGRYVYSRARYDRFKDDEELENVGAYALQLLNKEGQLSEEGVGVFLGEMLLYSFLEHALNAPKIMSKIELTNAGGIVHSKSDGVHLLIAQNGSGVFHQLVFGASNIVGDLQTAINNAFTKILDVRDNADSEFQVVENTIYGSVFDADTSRYMMSIIKPVKRGVEKPEPAFGVFLGYTIAVNRDDYPDKLYRDAIKEQMRNDIQANTDFIKQKISALGLGGYSFYFYVLPFNDAQEEKDKIMKDILEGRVQ